MTEKASRLEDELSSRSYPIREDMTFQRRGWIGERFAWAGMGLVLFLALLGLFSHGPLSDAVATLPGGDTVIAYDRFVRSQALTRFTIDGGVAGASVELRLGHGFLEAYELRAIQPEPDGSRSDADALYYSFPVRTPGVPIRIVIDAKRVGWGPSSAEFGFEGRPGLAVSQFAYP